MPEANADRDGPDPRGNGTISFSDAEAEIITANAPTYNDVIAFSDAEAEIITANAPTYNDVIAPSDDTVPAREIQFEPETITGNVPLRNSGQVIFTDYEVDPIFGGAPPYEVIASDDSEAESITARRPRPTGGPYQHTVILNDSEGRLIEGTSPQRRQLGSDSVGYEAVRRGVFPGPEQVNRPITIRTTGPSDRPPWWPESTGISFELQDAWSLPAPPDIQTELPLPQTQVLSWLRRYQNLIIAAEKRWHVDRRAIAAAIAWEALENVRTVSIRAAGPAKVHTNADVVREVEAAGYLPRQTASARRELLKTPVGAITYVGAIMNAKARIAEALGFPSIRNRVDILTNEFQGRSLQQWTDHLLEKKDTVFVGENTMSSWAAQHLQYIELGVGTPDNAAINASPP